MAWKRAAVHFVATSFASGAFLASGALSLIAAGCDSGNAVEASPRTAVHAEREVLVAPSSHDAVDEQPTDKRTEVTATSAEPVVATKPVAASNDVELASAKIVADDPPTDVASAEPPPRLVDAASDASKYPGGIIPASPTAQPLPGGPRLLVPHKTFRPEGKPPALRVSYDDLDLLKVLNVDPVPVDVVDQFPDWLRQLDGQQVRIRGFMYPSYEEMLSAFVLTRDTGVCCFGPNPKVYYLIGVKLKEGSKVKYVQNRPVDVVGTFHIQPVVSDGNWFQLYKITDAAVVE